ncbi:SDR family NAD(P)-dependent oxidoreductase [Alkalimarinus sediminis]|uniref:SDR family NAD(P)-dependent oxidoreductase n=1 Tax=Alkalimarinus sediminis TaxID=1632866 RepID=A0A9E8HK83_9ALTE|nr:SDR family NAD(P)-dependent oxidoreductase [Alkalimarinus sediminis]UZW75954.1 SDR family NAD(P)-dependent oxidoreductase [Alkalimarinus sediminis]
MNTKDKKRAIWIVGASTGIGEALFRELNNVGNTIFISARNKAQLESIALTANATVEVLELDITDEFAVSAAAENIRQSVGRLDQVIVNAGTCEYIDSDEIDMAAVRRVMDTNFWGALNVINAALPLLRSARAMDPNNAPQLAIMSSSVTYQALPRAGAYGASKAALRYFVESLKLDLQHEGIDIRVISPGFVKTPLTDKNDFDMPFIIDSEVAAGRIVDGLNSNRFDIHFPSRFTRILKGISLLPDSLRFKLVGKASRHPETLSKEHPKSTNDHYTELRKP